jgi:hypothetical protein
LLDVRTRITGFYVTKQDPETVSLRLDAEDSQMLADLVKAEKLSKSDVIRRAIRAYAEKLGVMRKSKQR